VLTCGEFVFARVCEEILRVKRHGREHRMVCGSFIEAERSVDHDFAIEVG
jgi:hypothetical protein